MKASISLLLTCVLLSSPAYGSYQAGADAFRRGDFLVAQQEWARASASGDLVAQYQLAAMLLSGKHAQRDSNRALDLLRDAAAKGSGDASYALYVVASTDDGVSTPKLIELLEAAAARGSRDAKFKLESLRTIFLRVDTNLLAMEQESWLPISFQKSAMSLGLADRTRGKSVYESFCSLCHAPGLANAPIVGDKERWSTRQGKGLDALATNAIKGFGAHPPKGGRPDLSNDSIREAVYYMLEASK